MVLAINSSHCLENQFLVSMPQLNDPNFNQTVILLCKHDETGAMGIVINRLTGHRIGDIFAQLHIDVANSRYSHHPVLDGGPVYPELGLIVHNHLPPRWESTMAIGENLRLTSSKDILSDIARGEGPEKVIMSLGYAGWAEGQLEHEIQQNAWFTTPADHDILFDSRINNKWQQSARLLGIDTNHFSHQIGHA